MTKKLTYYQKAIRYIDKAEEQLKKSRKYDQWYEDKKYVKSAGGMVYTGVKKAAKWLILLNEFEIPKDAENCEIKEQLRKINDQILNEYDNLFSFVYLAVHIHGLKNIRMIKDSLKEARMFISYLKPYDHQAIKIDYSIRSIDVIPKVKKKAKVSGSTYYKKAIKYIERAEEILKKSATEYDGYAELKYVKSAGRTVYTGIEKSAKWYIELKGENIAQDADATDINKALIKINPELNNLFNNMYTYFHVAVYHHALNDIWMMEKSIASARVFIGYLKSLEKQTSNIVGGKLKVAITEDYISKKVKKFKTKNKIGFTESEIKELLKDFPDINMAKFKKALNYITCMEINNEIITYRNDILNALCCGVQNRNLTISEFD